MLFRSAKTKRLVDRFVQQFRAHQARMNAAREDVTLSAKPKDAQLSAAPTIKMIPPPVEAITAPVPIRKAESATGNRSAVRAIGTKHKTRRFATSTHHEYRPWPCPALTPRPHSRRLAFPGPNLHNAKTAAFGLCGAPRASPRTSPEASSAFAHEMPP